MLYLVMRTLKIEMGNFAKLIPRVCLCCLVHSLMRMILNRMFSWPRFILDTVAFVTNGKAEVKSRKLILDLENSC